MENKPDPTSAEITAAFIDKYGANTHIADWLYIPDHGKYAISSRLGKFEKLSNKRLAELTK